MQIIFDTLNNWDVGMRAWATGLGYPAESGLRLILAVVAGGLVGLEREVRGRQAGFRTYILVSLGSALVMLVSTEFARHEWPSRPGVNLNIDPARIAYGVMTGVGFLGAGTIIHNRGSIRGLTTAAGLWCVAAVGLAVGLGIYMLSGIAVLLMLSALWILDYAEDMIPKLRYRTVRVRTKYKPGCVAETVAKFKKGGLHVVDAAFERSADMGSAEIDLHIAFVNSDQYYNLERELEADPDYHLLTTRELEREEIETADCADYADEFVLNLRKSAQSAVPDFVLFHRGAARDIILASDPTGRTHRMRMFGLVGLLVVIGIMVWWFASSTSSISGPASNAREQAAQIAGHDTATGGRASESAEIDLVMAGGKPDSILVTKIVPGGAYEKYFGLKPDDAIIELGPLPVKGHPSISSNEDASAFLMDTYQKKQSIVVVRDGNPIKLPQAAQAKPQQPAQGQGSTDPLQQQLEGIGARRGL